VHARELPLHFDLGKPGDTGVVEALCASTIAADKNPLAVRLVAAHQSDAAVIGPTGQARLGLADDPRRLEF
jgi:hypothetical protein